MTLTNVVPRKRVWEDRYCLSFTSEDGRGYSFDLTGDPQHGFRMVPLTTIQQESFTDAISRPWEAVRVVNRGGWDATPAHGTCACRRTVWLENDNGHGIDCDCGRIYNALGRELAPRSQWEEPWDEDSTQPYCVEFGYAGSDEF